jgi:thiol-disulfide isomerase/thioredoxin
MLETVAVAAVAAVDGALRPAVIGPSRATAYDAAMRSTTARFVLSAALAAMVLGACSSGGGAVPATPGLTEPPAATPAPPTDAQPTAAPSSGDPAAPTTAPTAPAVTLTQPWATAELVDVATGETFRIADLAGRPIIVETMAIWCTSCLAQQGTAYEVLAGGEPGAVDYILIDVDPSETADALADYRERNGFTGRYVIASNDLARALVAEFGDQVLNPPVTPMIVIGTDGTVTLTPFGKKSQDDLRTLLDQHGA